MKKAIFLREGDLDKDSRALKELIALSGNAEVQVVGMRDSDKFINYKFRGTTIPSNNIVIQYKSKFGHIWALLKYYGFALSNIRKNKSDLSFVYAVNLWLGLVAYIAKVIWKTPYIYDIYDSLAYVRRYPVWVKNILVRIETIVVNHSDTTFIASDERKSQLSKVDYSKIEVVFNSPEIPETISNIERAGGEKFRIAYIGGLSNDRAIPELLQAISELPDFELIIGGDGALKSLVTKYADEYENIQFIGTQKYDDVLKIEAQADALTALYDPDVPNHRFASPNKFFEAFALGKPLIMFKDTGMDKWIDKYDVGVVFLDTNVVGIKTALQGLQAKFGVDNSAVTGIMKKVFSDQFSWTKMTDKVNRAVIKIGNY